MVNVSEVHVCFSQYDNDSLRIDMVNAVFDVLEECTVETDSIDDFEEVKGFSEKKNDRIRGMHRNNLIVAIKADSEEVLQLLRCRDIIQALPLYLEKKGKTMLAYYELTNHAIDQKCEIIDDETYIRIYSDEMKEHFQGLPYNDFIYKVRTGKTQFAAIHYDGATSRFDYGEVVATTIKEVRDYLASPEHDFQYTFRGTAEQVYEKLFQLRRRVEPKRS
ncbi:hypothetical protein EP56_01865 [Listeriaceae bacterium FSL A5-0209]|nr:hypothetical protein EP56_01865 [Listeriaceae bacterium FSL A5-0209]